MAIITVPVSPEDAAKAASGDYGLKPKGEYILRIDSREGKPPKDANSYPLYVCKCTIMQSFNGQNLGKTITRRFSLHPKSIPYNLQRFLQAAGIAYQYVNGQLQFDDDHLVGAQTKVTCSHSPGNNRTFEDWENDEPVGGQTQQVTPQAPQMQQPGFAPPAQGWAPAPQFGAAPQQPQFAPPPQQSYAAPQYQPPMQQPMQQPGQGYPQQQPAPNGNGAPPWMQPSAPVQPGYPQQHVAGQGPVPPRGQG